MNKSIILIAKLLLLALAISGAQLCFAQSKEQDIKWPIKLNNTWEKSIPLGNEQIIVNNKFGKLNINTWDKKEIKVSVTYSVGAKNKEAAEEMLSNIIIDFQQKNDQLSFKTVFNEANNSNNNWNNQGYEIHIDYTVFIPNGSNVLAENSFGELSIGDFSGKAELISKHGSLVTGKLSNQPNIKVEFGKANIESLNNPNLILKYSKAEIQSINGKIKAVFDYCNNIDLPITNSIQDADIRSNYTSLYLVTDKSIDADYDITTNYSKASGKAEYKLIEVGNTNTNAFSQTKKYKGSLGKGGKTNLKLVCNYGSLRII